MTKRRKAQPPATPADAVATLAFPVQRTPRSAAEDSRIGSRLRAIRQRQHLTLEHLVSRTGLDKSYLSRLERDQTMPTVTNLVKICAALGIRPGELFDPPTANLVRRDGAQHVNFGGIGVTERLLSKGLNGELMVLRSVIEPGGNGGEELYTLDADISFVTVLRGQLEFIIEDAHYFLHEGDSLTLSSRVPHNWRNPTREQTEVIWVTSPYL